MRKVGLAFFLPWVSTQRVHLYGTDLAGDNG